VAHGVGPESTCTGGGGKKKEKKQLGGFQPSLPICNTVELKKKKNINKNISDFIKCTLKYAYLHTQCPAPPLSFPRI
jgi:hypothetical protein